MISKVAMAAHFLLVNNENTNAGNAGKAGSLKLAWSIYGSEVF